MLIFLLARTATVESISTCRTIEMLEPASVYGNEMIVASCSDGSILCYDYRGDKKWETPLSGIANHAINCIDTDNNGSDEVVAVNSNGTVYCLDYKGGIEWVYKHDDTPLTSLCAVKIEGQPYMVCCGENQELHYLSASGRRLGTISVLQEQQSIQSTTRLKSIQLSSGNEVIAMLSEQGEMTSRSSFLHLFQPLAKSPYKSITLPEYTPITSATVSYCNKEKPALLLGARLERQQLAITKVDIESGEVTTLQMPITKEAQQQLAATTTPLMKCQEIPEEELFLLLNSQLFLSEGDGYEVKNGQQQYNDLFYNAKKNKMVLTSTSTTSDESYIDIVSLNNRAWKKRLAAHSHQQ